MINNLIMYWTNFATTGDPNGSSKNGTLEEWKINTQQNDYDMKLDENLELRSGNFEAVCNFWDNQMR